MGVIRVCLAAAVWVAAATAWAQEPPHEETYESERVQRTMTDLGLSQHESPQGRAIEYVRLVTTDVFADDEFWPDLPPEHRSWRVRTRRHRVTFFNHFHALTAQDVVRRELLLQQGQPYDDALAEESMRNLRGLGIFALVRIVAVRVPGKDTVGLLVYTRDLWSLRLETDFQGTAGNFFLRGQLTERNLFGRNKLAAVRAELRIDTISVGEVYFDYRLLGGSLQLSESFDVIFNRASNEAEGAVGEVYIGKPFYRIAQRWAFDATARHLDHIVRKFDGGGELLRTHIGDAGTQDADGCDPTDPDCVPVVYAEHSTSASVAAHHRRGQAWLNTYTLGAAFTDRGSSPNGETALVASQGEAFREAVLPSLRTQVYPFVRHRFSTADYGVFQNLATFGVSESLRLGPWTDALLGSPLSALGSTDDAVFASVGFGYRHKFGRGMLDLTGSGSGRLQGGEMIDRMLVGRLRGATPPWLAGRLVLSARWEARSRDSARTLVFLDGNNGLRGYPIGTFVAGGSRVLGSLEYRSLPLRFESVQFGAVAFYDAGALYRALSDARMRHSVGVGVRALLPQLNRYTLRLDAGVPLDGRGFGVLASFGRGQAVALSPEEDQLQASDLRAR